MSAYQDLMTALATRRPDQSAADDERIVLAALAKHAHELAEQQRALADANDELDHDHHVYGFSPAVRQAADLIDPQGHEGERPDEEPTP